MESTGPMDPIMEMQRAVVDKVPALLRAGFVSDRYIQTRENDSPGVAEATILGLRGAPQRRRAWRCGLCGAQSRDIRVKRIRPTRAAYPLPGIYPTAIPRTDRDANGRHVTSWRAPVLHICLKSRGPTCRRYMYAGPLRVPSVSLSKPPTAVCY